MLSDKDGKQINKKGINGEEKAPQQQIEFELKELSRKSGSQINTKKKTNSAHVPI